jgi:cytoskeletal protein CcmA (bactofilin family)
MRVLLGPRGGPTRHLEETDMWKRENEVGPDAGTSPGPSPAPLRSEPEPSPRSAHATPSEPGQRAVLSPSIVVRGEVAGDEDLMVEGRVEGKINLRQNLVTVGPKGRVAAEIHARAIQIEGEVEGNLTAEEQIVLRKSSRVRGDLVSPRVTIEDGARFKGSIDMDAKQRPAAAPATSPVAAPRPASKDKDESSRSPEPKSAQAG